MAWEIVTTESPLFDKVFVNLGSFHIQMAFFKALGKFIDSCGVMDILIQSGLASGSVNSFTDSKHSNRCKRLHPQMSVALETLHLERFLSEHETGRTMLAAVLTEDYERYRVLTLAGEYGKLLSFTCNILNLSICSSDCQEASD